MQVKGVMTADPACCLSETTLQEVSQMMIDYDCGEIPVIEDEETKLPIGVITDRDIVCRTVARGHCCSGRHRITCQEKRGGRSHKGSISADCSSSGDREVILISSLRETFSLDRN